MQKRALLGLNYEYDYSDAAQQASFYLALGFVIVTDKPCSAGVFLAPQ